jgi:LytS/YehU family sensor histidine kinase
VPRAQLIGDVLRISPAATAIMDVSTNVGMINVDQRLSREFGKSQRFHSDSLLPQASVLG